MLRYVVTAILSTFAMMIGLAVGGCVPQTTVAIAGVATDHPHIVSQDEFVRVLRGNNVDPVDVATAYKFTTDACNVIMRARWQDRPSLGSVYPANIQDPILRGEVYTAVFSTRVCVA